MAQTPVPRRHTRQQLVLKVEFDGPEGFRSNFLSDLSEGGVRLNTMLEIGQHIMLNISFLGFVDPMEIEAVVQWTQPATHSDGPASGLAFVTPSEEARAWLTEVLDASTQVYIGPESSRVILLETQQFLREVYGQEVRNWAELRDEEPLDLVLVEHPMQWVEQIHAEPAMLAIMDVDQLPASGIELYNRVRNNPHSTELPIIVLGSAGTLTAFESLPDEFLFCLNKPLSFGVLMNTVRMLAHDPLLAQPNGAVGDGIDDIDDIDD